jgi:ATP-dependent DNA helicase RecG
MTFAEIEDLVRQGESEALEFKKSTGQLSRAAETLCALLNSRGGRVLIGVLPAGKIVGQLITDGTLRDAAQMLKRFRCPSCGEKAERMEQAPSPRVSPQNRPTGVRQANSCYSPP